jgi:hypothetical protein
MPGHISPWGRWDPLSPQEVGTLLSSLSVPWWIAGGWALDLYLGRQTRDHDDIDVQILRRDQRAVRASLAAWDLQAALPRPRPESWPFRPWRLGEEIDPRIHDIWCRPAKSAPWRVQLMLADSDGADWLYRRDPRLRRPLARLGCRSADGLPYIAPEVQLLFKAKGPREKDEADFARVVPHMAPARRQWLRTSLALVQPEHPWIGAL